MNRGIAVLLVSLGLTGYAQASQPEGWAYQLFVDRDLWQQHRINVAARGQIGLIADSDAVALDTDEGLLLNRAELLLSRPLRGRVLPGEGAKAGKTRDTWDWGFRLEGRYGNDFNPLFGIDEGRNQRLKLSLPQWYVQVYAPVLDGVTAQLGNFASPVGNENDTPNDPPRPFYSRSFAYEYGPKRHMGGLFSTRLPLVEQSGLWSADLGVVQGWDNLQDNNDNPSLIAALHWQRPDKRLKLDLEGIWGNEQSDSISQLQTPFQVVSSDGQLRSFQSLTARYWSPEKDWRWDLNVIYGSQQGGDTGTGLISDDSEWYGANLAAVRQLKPDLQGAMRVEWLRDEDAAHSNLPGGTYRSWSANISWFPEAWLRIRPELRYDEYSGAVGQPNQDNRWLFSIDATLFL